MRTKWVILGVVVLLGPAAWLALSNDPKTFDLGQVHRAIKSFGTDSPGVNVLTDGSSGVYPTTAKPRYIRSLVQWFREKTGNGIKGGIGWEETEYYDRYEIQYPSGDVIVVVCWTFEDVKKIGKVGRVTRIEVGSDEASESQADHVRIELRKRFPGLRCTIVKIS